MPSLQEEEKQEKTATQVLARLGGSSFPAWWGARARVRLCLGPGWGLTCKPKNLVLGVGACSAAILSSLRFLLCPFPQEGGSSWGAKGDGELGELSLEAQLHGGWGKKQLTGV